MTATPSTVPDSQRFNNTIKYQKQLLSELPEGAKTAIDAGCGEGLASRVMARAGLKVVGIDADADSIARAKAQACDGITYVIGDLMTASLEPADVVYSAATLHHLELEPAIERLKSLVAPGGRLAIVGLAMSKWPRDIPYEMVGSVVDKAHSLVFGSWEHGSPTVWPPPHSYEQVRDAAYKLLPGCTYERKLMWRYTIVWDNVAD